MKLSFSITATLLAASTTTVLALPIRISNTTMPTSNTSIKDVDSFYPGPLPNDPERIPIKLTGLGIMKDPWMSCGSLHYSYDDIWYAVQWAHSLTKANPPQGRGRADRVYTVGRYPHSFYHPDDFTFNDCPSGDLKRMEYPITEYGIYNGEIKKDTRYGPDRVIYWEDGSDNVWWCGGITHEGAESGKFVQCKINGPF